MSDSSIFMNVCIKITRMTGIMIYILREIARDKITVRRYFLGTLLYFFGVFNSRFIRYLFWETIFQQWHKLNIDTEEATNCILSEWWPCLIMHICVRLPQWLQNVCHAGATLLLVYLQKKKIPLTISQPILIILLLLNICALPDQSMTLQPQ